MSNRSRFSTGSDESLPAVPGNVQVVRHSAAGGRPSGAQSQAFTPQMILMALRRWWMVALPIGVVLAAIGGVAVFVTFEKTYTSSANFQIDSTPKYIAYESEQSRDASSVFVENQMYFLQSSQLFLGARELELAHWKSIYDQLQDGEIVNWQVVRSEIDVDTGTRPEALPTKLFQWWRERVSVKSARKNSGIYQVSFTSSDPKFSRQMVDAIVATYMKYREGRREVDNEDLLALLKERQAILKDEVDIKKKALQAEMVNANQGLTILAATDSVNGTFEDPLGDLRAQITEASVQKSVLEAKQKALLASIREDRSSEQAIPDGTTADNGLEDAETPSAKESWVNLRIEQDPFFQKLQRDILELELFIESVRDQSNLPGDPPVLQPSIAKLAAAKAYREKYRERIRPRVEQAIQEMGAQEMGSSVQGMGPDGRVLELARVKTEIGDLQNTLEVLREEDAKLRAEIGASGAELVRIETERNDLRRNQETLHIIEGRIESLTTEKVAPEQVVQLGNANVPAGADEEYPFKLLLLVVPAMLLAPFLLAIGWERILQRVHSAEALEKDLNLEVMGEISRFPKRSAVASRISARKLDAALRLFEESVDTLGTSLRLTDDLQQIRVLAVTSAASHEGKTSVATQLAISLSQATREKTLVIDGDMRSPSIHRVFELEPEPGLKDVLSGQCTLDDAIVTTWSDSLHILPAGKLTANPHTLLANGTARKLFDHLSERYRYIIVDTPPVLAAGETMVLCQAADAALMCAMWDVSRSDQVRRACKKLALAGVQPRGTILNGVPATHYAHRYGKYHSYA